jgi:hypothetical protein
MSKRRSRPFTMLALLAAGWLGLRAFASDFALLPPSGENVAMAGKRQVPAVPGDVLFARADPQVAMPAPWPAPWAATAQAEMPASRWPRPPTAQLKAAPPPQIVPDLLTGDAPPPQADPTGPPLRVGIAPARSAPAPAPAPATRRDSFAFSAWLLARSGSGTPALSGQAALGGSQAGVRGSWRLDRAGRAEAFARLSSTGRPGDGAEAALGVTFRPHRRLPLQLVAERRQALAGTGGRSAFAAYLVGGVDSVRAGPASIDACGAAGMVGLRSRDLFAEGSAIARVSVARIGPLDLSAGGGVWAAAQPGASRVDVGPRAQLRWREGPVRPVISLDWRQRVSGEARPRSGPALTVGADF